MRALYRGFTATVCGMIPYAGLSFYCFEQMKYLCMAWAPMYTCKPCQKNTGRQTSLWNTLMALSPLVWCCVMNEERKQITYLSIE